MLKVVISLMKTNSINTMKITNKKIVRVAKNMAALVFLCHFSILFASAQIKGLAEINFDTWLDNREYHSDYAVDQTLFGSRITPIIGLGWDEGHSIMIGGDFRAEFGSKSFSKKPEFIMYYNYDSEHFKAYAGVLPRRKVLGDYPAVFFSDSVKYYDTNIDGILLQYVGGRGYVELAIDWLSMISDSQREKFVVFSSGRLNFDRQKLFVGYHASMFHHSVSHTEEGVVDNLLIHPYIGMDFSKKYYNKRGKEKLQQICFNVGWLQAAQRDRRNENKFVTPHGLQFEFTLEKWGVGINNVFYYGDGLMPYYDRYGNGLYQGSSFYQTDGNMLNRTEIYWNPVKRDDINLQVGWGQIYDGHEWSSQQLIRLTINLNVRSLVKGKGK